MVRRLAAALSCSLALAGAACQGTCDHDGGPCAGNLPVGASCHADGDCMPILWCAHGRCAPRIAGGDGASCDVADDCNEGLTCYYNDCMPAFQWGEYCERYDHCAAGLACIQHPEAVWRGCEPEPLDDARYCLRPVDEGERCLEDAGCRPGLVCNGGALRCGPPGGSSEGEACGATRDCAGDLDCAPCWNVCVRDGAGEVRAPCGVAENCRDGLICTGVDWTCRQPGWAAQGDPCKAEADCAAGHVCHPIGCTRVADEGERCDTGAICRSGLVCRYDPQAGVSFCRAPG